MEELSTEPTLRWYVARTQTKRERLAAMQVRERLECDVFAPRVRYRKRTRLGMRTFDEALFPGYVFVRCDILRDLRHLQAIQGVSGLVRFGDRFPFVGDEVIDDLRRDLVEDDLHQSDPVIEIGQRVVVVDGPLKSLEAVVTGILQPGERVRILLEFLGQETEVAISTGEITPADYSPKSAFQKPRNE